MNVIAIIAAHLALLPSTSSAGREAKSAHAVAANDIWTVTRVKTTVFPQELNSLHIFLVILSVSWSPVIDGKQFTASYLLPNQAGYLAHANPIRCPLVAVP